VLDTRVLMLHRSPTCSRLDDGIWHYPHHFCHCVFRLLKLTIRLSTPLLSDLRFFLYLHHTLHYSVPSRLTMRVEVPRVGIAYQFTTVYPTVWRSLRLQRRLSCVIYLQFRLTSGVIGVLDTDNEMGSYNVFLLGALEGTSRFTPYTRTLLVRTVISSTPLFWVLCPTAPPPSYNKLPSHHYSVRVDAHSGVSLEEKFLVSYLLLIHSSFS
jgi:hypothetical protein